jgi:hypothetical protein
MAVRNHPNGLCTSQYADPRQPLGPRSVRKVAAGMVSRRDHTGLGKPAYRIALSTSRPAMGTG